MKIVLDNPDLVEELIEGKWTMSHKDFEEKYNSLSRSDMSKVSAEIYKMEEEYFSGEAEKYFNTEV